MSTAAPMTPIHPGEILAEDYLAPMGITQHGLAVAIRVPPRRINEIVHGKRRISADTALRLARYFGTAERFWIAATTGLAGRALQGIRAASRSPQPRQPPPQP